MVQINNINSDLLVLRKDGGFSTTITVDEINDISNLLNRISSDYRLKDNNRDLIDTAMTILRKNDIAAKGYSLDDILLNYSNLNRKTDHKNEQIRSDAFKVYYQYFVNMNKKRKMMLQRSLNDKTLFIYDDKLIFRIHMSGEYYNSSLYVNTFKIYNANEPIISNKPIISFSNTNCASLRYIKKPLINLCEKYCDEIEKYVEENIDTLVKMKVKKTPPIQDIFDVINTLDDEYLYFQYGARKIQSTSTELLVTLKMI